MKHYTRRDWQKMEALTHAIGGFSIGFIVVGALNYGGVYVGMPIEVDWVQNFYISVVITLLNGLKANYLRELFHNKRAKYKRHVKRTQQLNSDIIKFKRGGSK